MLRWSTATHHALYGPTGFYTTQQPAAHFRTSSQAAPFAAGIAAFVRRIDAQLGHPDPFTIVDVGAGDGGLLARITEQDDLNGRLRPVAVELRPRPEALGEPIEWRAAPPNQVAGVILACEWLDNVPV
ncbi:MAG: SAM-dependent methyltransferase, partial [Stackebrandtia sp.]